MRLAGALIKDIQVYFRPDLRYLELCNGPMYTDLSNLCWLFSLDHLLI